VASFLTQSASPMTATRSPPSAAATLNADRLPRRAGAAARPCTRGRESARGLTSEARCDGCRRSAGIFGDADYLSVLRAAMRATGRVRLARSYVCERRAGNRQQPLV
jgi:hypothetical protein